jgi:hypothetical protein
LRKLALIGLTFTVVLALAAVAIAQYAQPAITSMEGSVTPSNAGTKKKPKNGYIHIKFNVNKESFSTLRRIEYTIPKTLKLDGTGFPVCTADMIGSSGESVCPKKSLIGKGASTALLGPGQAPLLFKVNVYVAGKKSLTLSLTNPTTSAVFAAKISKSGKVGFDIPESVQNPTGGPNGPYTYVTSVTADLGKQSGIPASVKKGGKTHYFVSSIGCKSKKYTIGVEAFLADNPDPPSKSSITGSAKAGCKK